MTVRCIRWILLFSLALLIPVQGNCLGEKHFVVFHETAGAFPLVHGGSADSIIIDSADWPGVNRAAEDLSLDIERVTGKKPALQHQLPKSGDVNLIVIGTVDKSRLIADMVQRGKIDVKDIQSKWESTLTTVVDAPFPHVKRALVIAGSDKRGSIFGIYDLSEQMGVSPWYWWADVRIPHQDSLYAVPGRYVQGEPAVRYRGIFLNDESPALTGWARHTFGQLNAKFYGHVFELLLRLRANCLWPAMWSNAFNEDDPDNPKLADMYGIVMGTSHHEPMLRSQQEWKRHGSGPWDYTTNAEELRKFWTAGIERNKNYESLITVGMRGDGDMPMSKSSNVELLEKIVHDQLDILKQTNSPAVDADPKVWALYKEVQEYYEKGMRVPDDVTLLWSDDNWGDIRRLPTAEERRRKGGAGMYYHFDYVGDPRNYNWINTNAIPKVWDQMHLALSYGADRLWIVNVGDLKPMEFPMEFFLTYARHPEEWNQDQLHQFTVDWATRDFGPEHASEIAADLEDYQRYISRRKPEQISPSTYSLDNFQEASRVQAEWEGLRKRVDTLAVELPDSEKASFFELVQHPVEAATTITEMYIAAGRNALAAQQGRASTNDYAALTRNLFALDQRIADKYNHELLNGKWDHMMDQPHIGYTSWNSPKMNIVPAVTEITVPEQGELGVAVGTASGSSLSLHEFDSVNQQARSMTLFNKGRTPVPYHIASKDSWVLIGNKSGSVDGTVDKETDVPVRVDWSKAPAGVTASEIVILSADKQVSRVALISRRQDVTRENARGLVEGDGYVSIEAGSFSAKRSDGDLHWSELPGYGRTRSAMTVFPVTASSSTMSKAALEYQVHTYDSGDMQLLCILAPTLNFVPGRGLRFAVSIDDGPRQIVDALEHNTTQDWRTAVSSNAKLVKTDVRLDQPGDHRIKIWFVDPGVVLEKLVLSKGTLPASYLGPVESFRGSLR